MTLVDLFQLQNIIPSNEFDYNLLLSALAPYASPRRRINDLLRAGHITRVKKGLYVYGSEYARGPVCKETLANLIFGPSCLSLEYALAFHGLIPERVETLTSISPKRDKEFQTPLGRFTYRYLNLEKYAVGIEQVWIDPTHPVLMASKEKALCDYLLLNKIPEWESPAEARAFLEDDLRIDSEHWKRFNRKALAALNRVYASRNVAQVLEVLNQKKR